MPNQATPTAQQPAQIVKTIIQQAYRSRLALVRHLVGNQMLASFAPVRPCPARTVRPSKTVRASRKRPRAAFSEQHAQPADDSGSPDVQEKLMDIIRVQIGQEKVKDFVKDEGEKLRQAAEEVSSMCIYQKIYLAFMQSNVVHPSGALLQAKEEVDQLSKLTRDRSNLAFDSATVIELVCC